MAYFVQRKTIHGFVIIVKRIVLMCISLFLGIIREQDGGVSGVCIKNLILWALLYCKKS